MRMLIIDDDLVLTRLLGEFFAEEGDESRALSDPTQAVPQALATRPDVILLDLMLAGSAGQEVLAQLQAEPRTRRIPVIITTARHPREVAALGLPAAAILDKPFDLEAPLRVVHDLGGAAAAPAVELA